MNEKKTKNCACSENETSGKGMFFLKSRKTKKNTKLFESKENKQKTLVLLGNANTGKTTIFNRLTGLKQKIGNYPGVTVEKKTGTFFTQHGKKHTIVDLPGSNSLSPNSLDEEIARDVLFGFNSKTGLAKPNLIVHVLDASQLPNQLYFFTQVVELGIPTILVLNKMDIARKRGLKINYEHLEKVFGIKVIPTEAHNGTGLLSLRTEITSALTNLDKFMPKFLDNWNVLPAPLALNIAKLKNIFNQHNIPHAEALAMLTFSTPETREYLFGKTDSSKPPLILRFLEKFPEREKIIASIKEIIQEVELKNISAPPAIVSARKKQAIALSSEIITQRTALVTLLSDRFDKMLLHPFYGLLIFFATMGGMFWVIFSLAEYPMNAIESITTAIAEFFAKVLPSGFFNDLIVNGVIQGVGAVVIFLPQIAGLFFFIGVMESTGYMARASFLADKFMKKIGLSGHAFIPLLSSHACAIPGIMSARSIKNERERLLTIFIAPFMSCSARLPVYTILITAMLPKEVLSNFGKSLVLMFFYVLGILGAIASLFLLKKFGKKAGNNFFMMELPQFQMPNWREIFTQVFLRCKAFLTNAGTWILLFSVILYLLSAFPKLPEKNNDSAENAKANISQMEYSFLGRAGKVLEPVFAPIGYDWTISVGVLASFAAREVFVSTMAIIYLGDDGEDSLDKLQTKLSNAKRSNGSLLYTIPTLLSLLVFYTYALQCFSTVAVMRRETNSLKLPILQFCYMSIFAYIMAFIAYRVSGLFF